MEITDVKPVAFASFAAEESCKQHDKNKVIVSSNLALDPKWTNIALIIAFKISPNSIDRHLLVVEERKFHIRYLFDHNDAQVFRLRSAYRAYPTDAQIAEAIGNISE